MLKLVSLLLLLVVFLVGCGGGGGSETSSDSSQPSTATTEPAAGPDIGVGPITEFDITSIAPGQAAAGLEVFTAKCTACHKIEERYIGPALTGVTTRRTPEWILNMILNPDVMVKENTAARALLAEYIAPMTNQNLTQEEAVAILAYFLETDKSVESAQSN